jgi:hypothetical protein
MPALEVDGDHVEVRLSPLEHLGAFRFRPVRAPLSSVRAVHTSPAAWSVLRGLRAPGTGWPGVIALGTRRGSFGKDFAAVYRDRPAVVLELDDTEFSRLVLCVADPDAAAAAVESALRR